MDTDTVLRELAGLTALARSLARGDADADDLIQDTAVAAIEHPPATDRPVRPWLAVVLRNRWRMERREASRRRARDAAALVIDERRAEEPDAALERARVLEKLAAALVALDEPFRGTVMSRYFDGKSAAEIARAQGVPAGTVRWRLKTGLDRLREALDDNHTRSWRAVIAPLIPGGIVKAKTSLAVVIALLLLLVIGGVAWWKLRDGTTPAAKGRAGRAGSAAMVPKPAQGSAAVDDAAVAPVHDPLPGQGRATFEIVPAAGGIVTGRVINWSTGDGVADAELTFSSAGGATTIRSRADGVFELAPAAPGRFALAAIAAPGFLPYAPELAHSPVHLELTRDRAVRGITVFLFPAVDYQGRVVDRAGAPVARARVRLLGTPAGEQVIDKLATDWTTDAKGEFTFHAADDAVLEAVKGGARGWARLDGGAQITHELVIAVDAAPARDATITGRVVDGAGQPLADVLVRAAPSDPKPDAPARATAFATTGADGAFALEGLDRGAYDLAARRDDSAPATREDVTGGSRDVAITLETGVPIAGVVESAGGDVIPAFTLLVMRRTGTARDVVDARSIVDAAGRFEVFVEPGDYELVAAASGWAPNVAVPASTGKDGTTGVRLVVTAGATLRGTVVDGATGAPVKWARVQREARGGGATAQPANAGTVTRADGTFELTGIPPGPVSIDVAAGGYHPKIEAGMTATDGAVLGPLTVALAKVADGEQPALEVVGIGVALSPDGDALKVDRVIDGGGAAAAGIVAGDRLTAVDGAATATLGIDGAVARIRGVAGTTVAITVQRGAQQLQLVVERRAIRIERGHGLMPKSFAYPASL